MNVQFNHWIKEIDKDKLFLDQIKDQLTGWKINRLMEYINHERIMQLKEINTVLTVNPGIEITFVDYDMFERVKIIVENWKLQQEKNDNKPQKTRRNPTKFKAFPEYLLFKEEKDRKDIADFLKMFFNGAEGKKIACILQSLGSKKIDRSGANTKLYESIKQYYGLTEGCTKQAIGKYDKPEIWLLPEHKKEHEDVLSKINSYLNNNIID